MKSSIRGFEITALDSRRVQDALRDSRIPDFEDSIQFHSALSGARIIVTRNERDFSRVSNEVEILTPEDLIKRYL